VGKNTEPISKFDGFKDIMGAGVGGKADIAFMKLCYVDITRNSDVDDIFYNYKNMISDLENRYPETQFLHVSAPLCADLRGTKSKLKEFVKSLIGRPGTWDDNRKRCRYNSLLNGAFSQKETVFDLALAESLGPGGLRCYSTRGGEKAFMMSPQYTTDGGHLNENGRRRAAEQLLILLAAASRDK
jgi:lysophospholipase L1-like esterase